MYDKLIKLAFILQWILIGGIISTFHPYTTWHVQYILLCTLAWFGVMLITFYTPTKLEYDKKIYTAQLEYLQYKDYDGIDPIYTDQLYENWTNLETAKNAYFINACMLIWFIPVIQYILFYTRSIKSIVFNMDIFKVAIPFFVLLSSVVLVLYTFMHGMPLTIGWTFIGINILGLLYLYASNLKFMYAWGMFTLSLYICMYMGWYHIQITYGWITVLLSTLLVGYVLTELEL